MWIRIDLRKVQLSIPAPKFQDFFFSLFSIDVIILGKGRYIFISLYPKFTSLRYSYIYIYIYLSVQFHLPCKLIYPLNLPMPPPNISLPHCWANPPPPQPHSQTNIYRYISPLYQNFPPSYILIYIFLSVQFNLTNKLNNPIDLQLHRFTNPHPHNIFLPCTKLPYRYMLFNSPDKYIFKPYL